MGGAGPFRAVTRRCCSSSRCRQFDKLHELLSEPRIVDAALGKPTQVGQFLSMHQHDQLPEVQLASAAGADGCQLIDIRARLIANAGHNSAQVYVASAVGENA